MAARNYLTRQLALNGIDMTIEQFKVMVVLWKEGNSTQQNIADFVGKDKTNVQPRVKINDVIMSPLPLRGSLLKNRPWTF
jgi:DNA-binding MarR family transcriptional regulator